VGWHSSNNATLFHKKSLDARWVSFNFLTQDNCEFSYF
jgi:hypothetical protein